MVSKLTDKGFGHYLVSVVVELATTLLLTAHISEGSKAVIFHLSSINVVTRPAWLPSLKEAHHADTVRLCKIDINGAPVIASLSPKTSEKVKQGDWLRLLLRESLGANHLLYVAIVNIGLIHRTVDLKYVLSTQVVQIQYEGRMHVFSVSTVSTRTPDISESFGALSMSDAARLYIVDWDTVVAIEDNVQAPESKSLNVEDLIPSCFALSNNVHQLDVGVSDEPQGTDAYTAVGGLDHQIAQIRDLIEIPFRRPELFRHFRESEVLISC
jgi:AAA family ATPase